MCIVTVSTVKRADSTRGIPEELSNTSRVVGSHHYQQPVNRLLVASFVFFCCTVDVDRWGIHRFSESHLSIC